MKLKFLLFAPYVACVNVQAFQKGTHLCWFPRKNVRASRIMLSSLALPYLSLYAWGPLQSWTAGFNVSLVHSVSFACQPSPPLPHLAVGCNFPPPSFPVSDFLYQVGQPVGKDIFALPSQVGSCLFPNSLWPSQKTCGHKNQITVIDTSCTNSCWFIEFIRLLAAESRTKPFGPPCLHPESRSHVQYVPGLPWAALASTWKSSRG